MTIPPYPAAQAVASRARDHFAQHQSAARQKGLEDLAPEPDRDAIELITNAAFWASLRREEGVAPKISLAFLPPEQAGQALYFEQPIALTPHALTRLAPAVERPGIHLGVWRNSAAGHIESATAPAAAASDSLVVWGATRTIPALCFVLEVVAPGLLVIKHRSGQGSGKFVNVAVLEGDQVKFLNLRSENIAGFPPLLQAMLDLDPADGVREPFNVLLRLAVSMRTHARGGSLLLVPAGSDAWRESIVRPMSYAVSPPFTALGRLLREDPAERHERRWQESLRRAVDAVAGLTAVDGATILSDNYDLLGFGAKITRREGAAQVERVFAAAPLDGVAPRIVAPAQLGGTRHISAAQFAQDQRDAISLVASQDGRFTTFAWSQDAQMVHAYRIEALLL